MTWREYFNKTLINYKSDQKKKETRLCIHPTKTETVLFGTHQSPSANNRLDLFIGYNSVKKSSYYKYLRIPIDAIDK